MNAENGIMHISDDHEGWNYLDQREIRIEGKTEGIS